MTNLSSTGISLPAMFVRIRKFLAKSAMLRLSSDMAFLMGMIVFCNIHLLTGRTCQPLIFQSDAVMAGGVYRLITHPFVHLSGYHFLLDAGAFLLLYTGLDEKRPSRRMFVLSVCGICGLAAPLVFTPEIYSRGLCGLSGIAHGLMAYSALEMVRDPKNFKIGVACLLSVILKSVFEAVTGDVVFSFLHFGLCGVPIAVCHTGGVMGGTVSFFILNCADRKHTENLKKKENVRCRRM